MIFTLMFVICLSNGIFAVDDCESAKTIGDLERRTPSSVYDSAAPVCDNGPEFEAGWYRAGFMDMMTSVVLQNHCGSQYPLYLKGSIPENDGSAHDRLACVGDAYDDCYFSITIQVRNCSAYRIYKLEPINGFCGSYCFRDEFAGVPTHKPDPAEVKFNSIVWKPVGSDEHPRLVFECSFTVNTDDNYFYSVTWRVDNVKLNNSKVVKSSNLIDAYLHEEELTSRGYKHGIKLTCEVDARFARDASVGGPIAFSSPFFAGLKVITPYIQVELETEIENAVRFTPTVPFACENSKPNCELRVFMENPDSERCGGTEIVSKSQRCNTAIPGKSETNANDYYTTNSWKQTYSLNLRARNPTNFDLSSEFTLQLKTDTVNHTFWADSQLEDVTVNVRNSSSIWMYSYCEAFVDPHVYSFDHSVFEIGFGDFLLYRNKDKDQEVQISTKLCESHNPSGPYCVCAVTARVGRDIFIYSVCEDYTIIDFVLCEDSLLKVESDYDYYYMITFPTGTQVYLYMVCWGSCAEHRHLNLWIAPKASDQNNTIGLCGNLNGDCMDDFRLRNGSIVYVPHCYRWNSAPTEFETSWKLKPEENLFPPYQSDSFDSIASKQNKLLLCFCPARAVTVDGQTFDRPDVFGRNSGSLTECSYQEYTECTTERFKTFRCYVKRAREYRKKRDVQNQNRVKRSTTITASEAGVICDRVFNESMSYQLCSENVPQIDSTYLESCVSDVQSMNDASLADIALEMANSDCVIMVSKNISLQNESKEIVEIIYKIACPKNCSNQGTCIEGACVCDDGFTGTACSHNESAAPVVISLMNNGMCDLAQESCGDIFVYGEDIFHTNKTKCKIMSQQIMDDGSVVDAGTEILRGEQRSMFEAICPLPNSTEHNFVNIYNISLSNDGGLYSESLRLYVYDSTCQLLNNNSAGNITFSLASGYCFIDGKCVVDNSLSTQSCLQCNVTQALYNWSNVTGCKIETTSTQSTTNTVISMVTSSSSDATAPDTSETSRTSSSSDATAPDTSETTSSLSGTAATSASPTTLVSPQTSTISATAMSTVISETSTTTSSSVTPVSSDGSTVSTMSSSSGRESDKTTLIAAVAVSTILVVLIGTLAAVFLYKKFYSRSKTPVTPKYQDSYHQDPNKPEFDVNQLKRPVSPTFDFSIFESMSDIKQQKPPADTNSW